MNEQPKELALPVSRSIFKQWWFWLIILVILVVFFILPREGNEQKADVTGEVQTQSNEDSKNQSAESKVIFTHRLFDPAKVSHILPLGELNGGYVETQTINGVCVNNKDASEIEIYTPTDMSLEEYSYASDGRNSANYHLGFMINQNMKLSFDHITWVPDNVRAVTPPTQSSGAVYLKNKLSFKAGELIAKTSGTDKAHNWNIYLRDDSKTNLFVNQERYEKIKDRYSFLNAVCPFDYYEETNKNLYLALMGASRAGQSKTCGNASKDVKGSISGLWYLSPETDDSTFMGKYEGNYASPFSIYKNSADEIVLYEINKQRYILGAGNKTYKDPATVTDSQCYNLTEYGDDKSTKGYAYFKVVSDMEMKLAYSASGSCPASFPESGAITYYR